MSAKLIRIHPQTPEERKLLEVVEVLQQGGLVVYPTDSVYGIGCDIFNPRALERLCLLKGIKPEKHQFSFICYDLSDISNYIKRIDTPTFKVLKKALPGPFTFIFEASTKVPKMLHSNKKSVGIRVPDNTITRRLVQHLGRPILNTSVHDEDDILEYPTDPELIAEKLGKQVDMVIDGGMGHNVATTVVDCRNGDFEVLRQGLGDIDLYL